ncbi:hypothetical protein ACQK5W_07270 [Pantoea sp. FN060301]|uniref:hypothetical protein n=1 Tax=Pantoea sp. FN060301 TaxID=3420380 RepID=UPI003D18316B
MNCLLNATPHGGCRTTERQGWINGFDLQPDAVMMMAQAEKLYLHLQTEVHISPDELIVDRRRNRMVLTQRLPGRA